jgi:hypothetical protein
MEKMGFENYGFQTVFGFTDSIFIRHGTTASSSTAANTITTDSSKQCISKFLEDCQHQLIIKIEHKNRFLFTIIFDKKNRYIAWTGWQPTRQTNLKEFRWNEQKISNLERPNRKDCNTIDN